jgi:hypothetical protein
MGSISITIVVKRPVVPAAIEEELLMEFEFSKQIGVSPWYWWADVPVKRRKKFLLTLMFNNRCTQSKIPRNFY